MHVPEANSGRVGPLTPELVENSRGPLLWSIWARGLAVELLSGNEAEIAHRLRVDSARADLACEVYKMLRVDRAADGLREHVVATLLEILGDALKRSGRMPFGVPLDTAINFSIVPAPADVSGAEIASLRPIVDLLPLRA